MKGLLYKDLVSVWTNFKFFILLSVAFVLVSATDSGMDFLGMYAMIFAGMIPNSLMATEEQTRFDRIVLTMPIGRKAIVSEKYVLGLLLAGAVWVLSGIVGLFAGTSVQELMVEQSFKLVMGLAMPAFLLPVTFRLGAEKGRMAYTMMFGLILGIVVFLSRSFADEMAVVSLNEWDVVKVCAACLLVYPVSWLLSIRFYEKREY